MKQFKTILAITAFLFAGTQLSTAQASASKVCHVFTQDLINELPKAKAADKQIKDLQKTYDTKLDAMDKELKAKFETAKQQAKNRSKEENDRILAEIEEGQKKLEDYYSSTRKQMAQKREDLYTPILKEVRDVIQKTARAKGFDYVLDSTTGLGVIMADGYDLTGDVKKALGVQ